jgi:hypothetical protein
VIPSDAKQAIGERIYDIVARRDQFLAGKITGMLLELAYVELQELINNNNSMQLKITEAINVLQVLIIFYPSLLDPSFAASSTHGDNGK